MRAQREGTHQQGTGVAKQVEQSGLLGHKQIENRKKGQKQGGGQIPTEKSHFPLAFINFFYLCLCSIRLHYRKDKKTSLKAFCFLQACATSAPASTPFFKACLNLARAQRSLNPHLASLVLLSLFHNLSTQSTASALRPDENKRLS